MRNIKFYWKMLVCKKELFSYITSIILSNVFSYLFLSSSYYPGYYSFDNGTPSPKVTTSSDLDLDLLLRHYNSNNNNYNNFYYPTVLPEAAIKVSNYNSRKARLWRKVYYLEYLRELYRRYLYYKKRQETSISDIG